MHGWVGHVRPKKSTVATTPINTAFKICFSRRKNEVLNRLPSEVMAGLGLSGQKSAARRNHAHRNRLQNLY
jgi:hypothetical protein